MVTKIKNKEDTTLYMAMIKGRKTKLLTKIEKGHFVKRLSKKEKC